MSKFYRALKRSIRSLKATEYAKRTGKRDWKYVWFDLYCGFLDTFVYSWLTPITVFWESCVRVWHWFPIIWKDRHWDWGFILDILQHKIRFTRECIGKYDRHVTAKEDCRQMRIAELLIERLKDPHNYVSKDWDEHWAKWPTQMFNENKDGSCTIPPPPEESSKDVRRMMSREEYMWKQDMEYLMKHLRKHLRKWWD